MTRNLSVFYYLIVSLSSIVTSRYLEKELNNSQKKYKYYFLFITLVILLSILPGLRSSSVGIDTKNYLNAISYMLNRNYIWYKSEPGLFLLSRITVIFTKHPNSVLMTSSLFMNTLIILGLTKHKKNISIPLALTVYICMFYLETFNIMRQWLAISVVFYAYSVLHKDENIKFVILTLIASIFHNTAIIALLILLINIVSKLQINNVLNYFINNRKQIIVSFLLIITGIVIVIFKINLISRFKYIFSEKNTGGNYGLLGWVRLLLGLYLLFLIYKNNQHKNKLYIYYVFPYLILLITEVSFYTSRFTLRLFLYLSSLQILTIGFVVRESKIYRNYYYFLIPYYILNIALFVNYILNGKGILPYSFFWQ